MTEIYLFDDDFVSECCGASLYLDCDICPKCLEMCNKIKINE